VDDSNRGGGGDDDVTIVMEVQEVGVVGSYIYAMVK